MSRPVRQSCAWCCKIAEVRRKLQAILEGQKEAGKEILITKRQIRTGEGAITARFLHVKGVFVGLHGTLRTQVKRKCV
jgi:hypothetical protein